MNAVVLPIAKFRCGKIVTTDRAKSQVSQDEILVGIQRHQAGDWGDLYEHEGAANDLAIAEGSRIWSVYRTEKGVKFWLITEADRSVTTVLLPEECYSTPSLLPREGASSITHFLLKRRQSSRETTTHPVDNRKERITNGESHVLPEKLESRTLKIEEDGDFSEGKIKPKIRITGHWLQRAGFPPGGRVNVNCVAHGVIELRSMADENVNPF